MASDPASFRDSTQIVLPPGVIEDVREELDARFRLSLDENNGSNGNDGSVRIIASPVVIKEVNRFLARQGVNLR